MTASATPRTTAAPFDWRAEAAEEERGRTLRPREGWTALFLVVAMVLTAAIAIDEANWAGNAPLGGQQTAFLSWAALLSVLVGLLVAKSPLSTFAAHLAGASAGAAFILVGAANAISTAGDLTARLRDLDRSMETFYHDLVVLGIRSAETSAFLLIIGAIVWGVGQFAAFNVFRRGRVMPAILCTGLALLINMSVTVKPQFHFLVAFALASLLLILRLNLLTQLDGWRRRRIGDAPEATGIFLRSGAVFVAIAMLGSVTLAYAASSAPLANAWRDLDDHLITIGSELNRVVGGVTGPARGPTGLFGTSQTVSGVWEASTDIVFTTTSSDGEGHYLRGATYDRFDGFTWQQTDRARHDVAAGQELLAGTIDDPTSVPGTRPVQVTVTSVGLAGGSLLAPATPFSIDRSATVTTSGPGGPMFASDLSDPIDPGESYTVQALVPVTDTEDGAVTAADLAAAGVTYPEWARRYVEITPGSFGPEVAEITAEIVDELPAGQRDPYHIAEAIQDFLYRDGGFNYSTDVRGFCQRERVVDCFMRVRAGYCEYFATAMVAMLRTQLIPSRLAMGFLPGTPVGDGAHEVSRSAAHAWVEVYFPGYGWVRFDPTPGNQENGQQPTELDRQGPVTAPLPSEGPRPAPSFRAGEIPVQLPDDGPPQVTPPPAVAVDPGLSPLALIVAGVIVAALLATVLLLRRRALPYPEPDVAYRGIARLATRFGYGPRPTQTAYEYAGTLSEVVPSVRAELQVVARAKVESTYARRRPSNEVLAQLREAYRRVRMGLLRLLFRARRGKGSGPRDLIRR